MVCVHMCVYVFVYTCSIVCGMCMCSICVYMGVCMQCGMYIQYVCVVCVYEVCVVLCVGDCSEGSTSSVTAPSISRYMRLSTAEDRKLPHYVLEWGGGTAPLDQ